MQNKINSYVISLPQILPVLPQMKLKKEYEEYQSTVEGSVTTQKRKRTYKICKQEKLIAAMKQQLSQQQKCYLNSKSKKFTYQQLKAWCPSCRLYFYSDEFIVYKQNQIFLDHENLFSMQNLQATVQAFCAFSNSQKSGQIYLGIKQSHFKQYRTVIGTYLTEIDLQNVPKIIQRCFSQRIINTQKLNYSIDIIPIRQALFPQLTFLEYLKKDQDDQLVNKIINVNLCPFIPGKYVIRINIEPVSSDIVLSCFDKLNNQIIPIIQVGNVKCQPYGKQIVKFLSKRVFKLDKSYQNHGCQVILPQKITSAKSICKCQIEQSQKRANKIRLILDYQDKAKQQKNKSIKIKSSISSKDQNNEQKLRNILSGFRYNTSLKIKKADNKSYQSQSFFIIIELRKDHAKDILYELMTYLNKFDNDINIKLDKVINQELNQYYLINNYFSVMYTMPVYCQQPIYNNSLFDLVKRENLLKSNTNNFKKNKQ